MEKRPIWSPGPVTLEVFNPTGATEVTELFVPRLADLHGKTICELDDGLWESNRTFPVINQLLQRQFPTAKIVPYTEFPTLPNPVNADPKMVAAVKEKGCQAVIVGNAG